MVLPTGMERDSLPPTPPAPSRPTEGFLGPPKSLRSEVARGRAIVRLVQRREVELICRFLDRRSAAATDEGFATAADGGSSSRYRCRARPRPGSPRLPVGGSVSLLVLSGGPHDRERCLETEPGAQDIKRVLGPAHGRYSRREGGRATPGSNRSQSAWDNPAKEGGVNEKKSAKLVLAQTPPDAEQP
jgi:hypothetical protein